MYLVSYLEKSLEVIWSCLPLFQVVATRLLHGGDFCLWSGSSIVNRQSHAVPRYLRTSAP